MLPQNPWANEIALLYVKTQTVLGMYQIAQKQESKLMNNVTIWGKREVPLNIFNRVV